MKVVDRYWLLLVFLKSSLSLLVHVPSLNECPSQAVFFLWPLPEDQQMTSLYSSYACWGLWLFVVWFLLSSSSFASFCPCLFHLSSRASAPNNPFCKLHNA